MNRTGIRCAAALAVTILCMIVMLGCARRNKLYILGDAEGIGATVDVNGQRAGVMTEVVYGGSTSKNPTVVAREEKLRNRLKISVGDRFSLVELTVDPAPRYEIVLTDTYGKRLSIQVEAKPEIYLRTNVRDGILREVI